MSEKNFNYSFARKIRATLGAVAVPSPTLTDLCPSLFSYSNLMLVQWVTCWLIAKYIYIFFFPHHHASSLSDRGGIFLAKERFIFLCSNNTVWLPAAHIAKRSELHLSSAARHSKQPVDDPTVDSRDESFLRAQRTAPAAPTPGSLLFFFFSLCNLTSL